MQWLYEGEKVNLISSPYFRYKKNKQLTWGLCIIASKNHHQNPGISLDCYLRSFIHVISFNTNINLGIIKKSEIKAPCSRLLLRSPRNSQLKILSQTVFLNEKWQVLQLFLKPVPHFFLHFVKNATPGIKHYLNKVFLLLILNTRPSSPKRDSHSLSQYSEK